MTRDQAIARLLHLAEVTVERGATEAEEESAAAAAHRLIARHGLTLAEVESAAHEEELRRGPRIRRAPPPPPPWMYPQPFGPATATMGSYGNAQFFGVRIIWV